MAKKKIVVITYGTYDLLHFGHLELLRRAQELGDYLIVALSTDEFNMVKHKESYKDYEHRKAILEAIRYVDKVIPENNWEQKREDIVNHKVDILVMGSDWEGEFDSLKGICRVVYLKRTDGVSTTKLKKTIKKKVINNDRKT